MTDFKVFRLKFGDIGHNFTVSEKESEDIFAALDLGSAQNCYLAESILAQIYISTIHAGIVFHRDKHGKISLGELYDGKRALTLQELLDIASYEEILHMYLTIEDVTPIEIHEEFIH